MLETNTTSSRSRKANGQGHTYPFGKGYRTVIEDKGRTVTATGKTEAQSKSRARAKLKTLPLTTGGLMPGAAQIQLGTFLTRWLTFEHKHRIAPTTYKRYVGLANMFIIPAIGQVTLGKLSKHHINQLMSQMAGAGQSPRSQQQARALLSVALNAAVEDDLIAFNPVSTSRRIKVGKFQIEPLSETDVNLLLTNSAGTLQHVRLRVALLYGLRQGEALGLRWSDIDFKKKTLTVRYQLQKVDGTKQLVKLKTVSSRRTLPLDENTLIAFQEHKRLVSTLRLSAGENWTETDLVFPNTAGGYANSRWDHTLWARSLEEAGIPKRRLHDARHTAATILFDRGIDIEVIRRFLGHSSVELTAKTYVHHSDRALRGTSDILAALGGKL
jgi:integrase